MPEKVSIENCLQDLKVALGEKVTTDAEILLEHGKDSAHHAPQAPDVVVHAASTEEVQQAVRICGQHGVPIIPFGTGTAVEGGVVATQGGVCIVVQKMNRIKRLSAPDMDVTVEAGVTRTRLDD